mmetsp:Transcript_9267/g.14274  ORF Transcript_9267/g.14274 Transcript_9267/m.14274 type:complete len:352 (-) Transcript_9267:458-1513(-)
MLVIYLVLSYAFIGFIPQYLAEQQVPVSNSLCRGCALYPPNAPTLYISERKDGPGATMHTFLYAMGAAARNGMNFGGVLQQEGSHIFKGINVTKMCIKVFAIRKTQEFYRYLSPDFHFLHNYSTLSKLDSVFDKNGHFTKNSRIFLRAKSLVKDNGVEGVRKIKPNLTLDEYLSPKFLQALRGCQLPWMENEGCYMRRVDDPFRVVVHVRRGDRFGTADEHVFRVADQIQRLVPGVDILVHTLMQGFDEDSYRKRGYKIHAGDINNIDVNQLFEAWTMFARADVLVVDTSSFSWVPAFFNPNCVIYHPYRLHYGKDRAVLNSWEPSTDEAGVARCVLRQVQARADTAAGKQ